MSIKDHLAKSVKHGDIYSFETPVEQISFSSKFGRPKDNWFEINIPTPHGDFFTVVYEDFSPSNVSYEFKNIEESEFHNFVFKTNSTDFEISIVRRDGVYAYGFFSIYGGPEVRFSLTEDEAMAGVACMTGSADKYFQANSVSDVNVIMRDVINEFLKAKQDADS